jgi:hypothetical protein
MPNCHVTETALSKQRICQAHEILAALARGAISSVLQADFLVASWLAHFWLPFSGHLAAGHNTGLPWREGIEN